MFIRQQKSPTSKRIQIHLVEGFRDEHGKSRQRIIKNYGELKELLAKDPDILSKLDAEAKELTAKKKEAHVSLEVDCLRARRESEHQLNYGYFFLEAIYKMLDLPAFLKRKAKSTKSVYDLNEIVRLLVFSRVLSPASKSSTVEAQEGFFAPFDCEIHDVYRALGDLDALSSDIQLHLHKTISKKIGRDAALVFYDVTNYYFECDFADDFRKKGPSKERRRDPIVQMGLLIDGRGIPIAYRLFEGNTHDTNTLVPVLEELKARYGFKRIVVVADKGLNSGKNLGFIIKGGDGYIVSQRVRGKVDPEILLSVKDKEGWVFNDSGTFAIKSFIRRHKLTKDVIATEKVICFWSEAYALRESYRRGDLLEAVEELLAHPWRYEAANNYGRKRYIKETYVTDAGEAAKKIISFNKDRFKDDAELDGFYCILTSETKMRDDEIVKHYRGLIRIEESFRVIKSDLEGRPVFVWSRPHINAHFLICFIALVIMRILQDRVGYTISPTALKEALATARCTPLEKSIYVIDETTDAYKQLETSLSVSLSNRYAPVEVIKAYRKQIIANVKDHNVFKS